MHDFKDDTQKPFSIIHNFDFVSNRQSTLIGRVVYHMYLKKYIL